MEEIQKKEFLSNLYSLRAGLSVISIEKEKYEKLRNAYKKEEETYNTRAEALNKQLNSDKSDLSRKEQEETKPIAVYRLNIAWNVLLGIMFPALAVLTIVLWIASMEADLHPIAFLLGIKDREWGRHNIIMEAIELFGPICAAALFAFLGVIFWGKIIIAFEEFSHRKKVPMKIIDLEYDINKKERELMKAKDAFSIIKKARLAELDKIKNRCFYMFQALEKTYGNFLDLRDWKHTDLMIFYFESRRADDMKEALLLVDRQVQTDSIIEAIGRATEELRQTILYSTIKTAQIMSSGFSLLSNQMGIMQTKINKQNIQLEEIASLQYMNNALQKKANANSLQLMEDVSYMRRIMQ